MKKGIHPEYKPVVFHDVSVDFKVLSKSTMTSKETIKWEDGKTYPVIRVDLSSASHSFYTGKRQQVAEKGGRIEQFRKRYGVADPAATAPAAVEGDSAES
ncbi:MAG: type B 50S ribosomal protein L31 [Gemmatimonadota bacterium]